MGGVFLRLLVGVCASRHAYNGYRGKVWAVTPRPRQVSIFNLKGVLSMFGSSLPTGREPRFDLRDRISAVCSDYVEKLVEKAEGGELLDPQEHAALFSEMVNIYNYKTPDEIERERVDHITKLAGAFAGIPG